MNRRKTALSNLITYFNVVDGDLTYAWHGGQPSCVDRDAGRGVRECLEILFLDFVLKIINLLLQLILLLPLPFQLLLHFSDSCILCACGHRPFWQRRPATAAATSAKRLHPVPIIICDHRRRLLGRQIFIVLILELPVFEFEGLYALFQDVYVVVAALGRPPVEHGA